MNTEKAYMAATIILAIALITVLYLAWSCLTTPGHAAEEGAGCAFNISELEGSGGDAFGVGYETDTIIGINDDSLIGPLDARITMIEFSDFQCSHCFTVQPIVKELLARYPDDLKLAYRDFPNTGRHEWAFKAAEGSECGHTFGKYWEYHDILFEKQPEWKPSEDAIPLFKQYAVDVGMEAEAFNACLDSGEKEAEVQNDIDEGLRAGVSGTPTFFFKNNTKTIKVVGVQPIEGYEEVIDRLLEEEA